MSKDRKKLSAGFTAEQTEWLDKYDDIINEMHSVAEVEAFKYGFRLAMMLKRKHKCRSYTISNNPPASDIP